MTGFELSILDFIQNTLRCSFLDMFMTKITLLGNGGVFWIILTLLLLISKKYRKAGIIMAIALILDLLLCNMFLKPVVARIRPFYINTDIVLLIPKPSEFSFPSGHSAVSFAGASAMLFAGNKHWKWAMVIAAVIAFSRLYLYVHFPTDVIGGALLGIFCGYAASKIYTFISRKKA